ncbi:MAG: hypothetical protein M1825_004913 [Sarcosagium campestre]|nr:MAG: hypothetical protein M1825_004913 [Sarcosagium campestre]
MSDTLSPEDSYSVTRNIDGRTYHLSLTDTAGQEEYRGLWAASNLRSDAFLLVYDITNADSLAALDHFIQLIQMEAEQRADASPSSGGGAAPVMIIAGNKCDLAEMRQVKSAQGLEYARNNGCGFMETSARNMVNIEETFALLVRRVMEQRRLKEAGSLASPTSVSSNGHAHHHHHQLPLGSGAPASKLNLQGGPTSEKYQPRISSVDLEDRPGHKTQRGGFWARLKCW